MGILASAASVLFTIESLIPSPLPWFRLGLANAVSLLALRWWGFREALIIFLVRLMVGSLLVGRLISPIFFFSLSGGIAALFPMAFLMRWHERFFSLIGISIAGAVCHNVVQLSVAYVYVKQLTLFRLIPIFMINGMLAGMLIGFLCMLIDDRIQKMHLDIIA